MSIKKKLLSLKKKRITLEEIAQILEIKMINSEQLYMSVSDLVKEGILSPITNSGMNGNYKYPLFLKYIISISTENDEKESIEDIRKLHPALQRKNYLVNHIDLYKNNKPYIERLNKYLFDKKSTVAISRKERSYEIFGEEKVLDENREMITFLKSIDLDERELLYYSTPEYCFHDYIANRKDHMTLLILENKDIWFNIRRRMFEDNLKSLFGEHIDGVIYGSGNKIAERTGALQEYVKFMGDVTVDFLYWGDIDKEGLSIYKKVLAYNPSLSIRLFSPGYKKMLEKVKKQTYIEKSKSKRIDVLDTNDISDFFEDEEFALLNKLLAEDNLVPQEIITYTDLME